MSVATELERIAQAKTDLKTAIETKGVEIDDTATIDTYASKVEEIQVGDNYYDTFWDAYQQNGERANYEYAFTGYGWTSETFKPKYDIVPTFAGYMFYGFRNYVDMVSLLEEFGITLDFSRCTNFAWMVYGSQITRIGVVDMSNVSSSSNANNVFRGAGGHVLKTIDKLIVSSKYPIGASSFLNCTRLQNITIEGTITGNFVINSSSLLTVDSIKSIITHLENYAGTDNEFVCTVAFDSTAFAKLEASETSPDGGTWAEYINSLGWNLVA